MIVYLDTSVILRGLLGEPGPGFTWGDRDEAVTSGLAGAEARRAIDRLRLGGGYTDEMVATAHGTLNAIESSIAVFPITRRVLARASAPFGTSVKALDAIHLATAIVVRERVAPQLQFATHDRQQGLAARALGFEVVGV